MNFFPRRLRRPVEKFRNFQFKVKQNTNSIFSTTTKKHFNLCDCNEKLFLTPYQTWGQRTLEINEIMATGERGEPFKWIQKNKRIRKKKHWRELFWRKLSSHTPPTTRVKNKYRLPFCFHHRSSKMDTNL